MMMLLGNNRINISGHTGGTCRTCKADQANIILNKNDFVHLNYLKAIKVGTFSS